MSKKRILVQAGHIAPREPGFEGGTGTIREQEFTRKIRNALCALLEEDGRFDAIPAAGDIPDGIKVDAAIFEHGDGSTNPLSTGFSFGYPNHGINKKLATLIGIEYLKIPGHPPHHADNYTGGLRAYYGYSRVDTAGPEVLVESGFLTRSAEQVWLFANVKNLAMAQYHALLNFFDMKLARDDNGWTVGDPLWENLPGVPRDSSGAYPDWFWPMLKEYERRRALAIA